MNHAFADLYAINKDFAGWIAIPSLNINYAVVKAADNDYYLRRDFYKNTTKYGVPFFDFRNSLNSPDRNTVIYGHNMRHDNKLFGSLEEYRTIDGFKKAPLIGMSTLYGDYTFKVYAVFISNSKTTDDNGNVFMYNFTSATNEEFANYIREIDKRKLYTTGVDINENDKIITLSTCCYDFADARLAVVGRLLRPGESPEVNTDAAFENPNPKFPQAYYDAKKMENPYKNDPILFNQ
jgi:SrtB family sortase